ncbi:UNVERIFIED_CONTAM: hypothetical protein GTU68_029887 [Idotea baltica]|nr:hypothetical protein [Idotea baltica]
MPMGTADMAAVLWSEYLNFNPQDPNWINRDRFVLSAGHGSMLLYSLLNLFNYDLPLEEIKNFRQWGSKTPGHPEYGVTPGVETTTGPLGQGVGNGIGMALSAKLLSARYDNLFDYNVYGIVSDGDLMEGIASEAASLAGYLKLDNLIYLYDDNNISIAGSTDLAFTEDVAKRFDSYNWYTQKIDGHNYEEIAQAIESAKASDKPSLICCKTFIGKGKNLRFGVREHAMGAIANGLAYSDAWFPYTGTFLVFSDYMRPSIRLAALSHIQSLFIFTHDSFWVGEDGPTHQPIEHVQSLRLIPNLNVFRPADGIETAMCYLSALKAKNKPSVLLFSRQGIEPLKRDADFNPDTILKGGYIASGKENTEIVLVASGAESAIAQEAQEELKKEGINIRVVSMPSIENFLEQDEAYRNEVIPPNAKKISFECGSTTGWERVIGEGLKIGKDSFGASAPGPILAEKFGLTSNHVSQKIKSWI